MLSLSSTRPNNSLWCLLHKKAHSHNCKGFRVVFVSVCMHLLRLLFPSSSNIYQYLYIFLSYMWVGWLGRVFMWFEMIWGQLDVLIHFGSSHPASPRFCFYGLSGGGLAWLAAQGTGIFPCPPGRGRGWPHQVGAPGGGRRQRGLRSRAV